MSTQDLAPVIGMVLHTYRRLAGFRGTTSEQACLENLLICGVEANAGRAASADEIERGRQISIDVFTIDARVAVEIPGEAEREARIDRALRRSEAPGVFDVLSGTKTEHFRLKTV
ncbi:MAG: hypothetical protein AAGD13_01050 [Pseudomonadota bacterium]